MPVSEVDPKPVWARRSTWAAAAGYLADAAAIVALVADLLPPEKAAMIIVVGTILARLQATFARIGGVNAAKRAVGETEAALGTGA